MLGIHIFDFVEHTVRDELCSRRQDSLLSGSSRVFGGFWPADLQFIEIEKLMGQKDLETRRDTDGE